MRARLSRPTLTLLLCAPSAAVWGQAARPPSPAPVQVAPRAASSERLPLRRVVLYKNGVGYFEHVGQVAGAATVSIELTSGQLNDVLKSLTALDLGGGRVTTITFDSEAPLDQRLKTLGLPLGAAADRTQVLEALRGTRVSVTGGGAAASGRLLSVGQRTRVRGEESETIDVVTVVTDAGDLQTLELTTGVSVRIGDPALRQQVGRYLDLVAAGRGRETRRLDIATAGTGSRQLFVSYISEVPVWKSNYRLVFPSDPGRRPLLQGWAIVDNTLREDWRDVELSLVAGAPQSFVQDISRPYYVARPVVPLPATVQLQPQAHAGALDTGKSEAADQRGDAAFKSAAMARPGAVPGGRVGGVVGGVPAPAPAARESIALARQEAVSIAQAASLGELFEYRLKEPVSIRHNKSALVPIVHAEVTVERVSLWSPRTGTANPLRSVWLTNDSGLTLDGGSVTLVEGEAFAGEGLLDPLASGERRLISYAADQAVRVGSRLDSAPQRVTRMRVARGVLTRVTEDRGTATYTIRNEDAQPRRVLVEHDIRDRWRLSGGVAPVETTATVHRFAVTVAPRSSETLVVDEVRPLDTEIAVSNLTNDHVALLLRGQGLDAEGAKQLQEISARKGELAAIERDLAAKRQQVERIGEDQARLRENMKALKGSDLERRLLERYTRELAAQEDQLAALRRETSGLEARAQTAKAALDAQLEALSVDVTLP